MTLARLPVERPLPRPGPSRGVTMNATVLAIDEVSSSIRRFRVRPDDGVPPFVSGQYFALGVRAEGRLLQRPYSTASAPDQRDTLDFLVRRVPGGALTTRLWALAVGTRVHLGRPKGLFSLDPADRRAHLFVATGTGIAPFVSMVATLATRTDRPGIVVVHGAARPAELAYAETLRGVPGARYVPAVSRREEADRSGWTGPVGRVGSVLRASWPDLALDPLGTVAYLCGNPGMIAGVRGLLEDIGLPVAAIRSEEYWSVPSS